MEANSTANDKKPVVMVVEDEKDVLRINSRMLKRRGFTVLPAENCEEAYRILDEAVPDLVILDIMLPDGSGYDICEEFRKKSDHPVIFLTGKDKTADKIEGLGLGGDYYLTKPYDPKELMAVAERLVERHLKNVQKNEEAAFIKRGSLTIDLSKSKVYVNDRETGVTAKELSLLMILIQNEDKEVSAKELYEKVWGMSAENDTRTVRFHIKNLREKIDAVNSDDYDIVSVYGKGYMFTTM